MNKFHFALLSLKLYEHRNFNLRYFKAMNGSLGAIVAFSLIV